MSDRSTADRHIARAAEQRARSPVLSQAGNEKYATGCGNLSMPSNHLDRQNKTQKLIKKNTNNIKMLLRTNHQFTNCKGRIQTCRVCNAC